MADDWDADDFEPVPLSSLGIKATGKGKWEDEDKEESQVKESWEETLKHTLSKEKSKGIQGNKAQGTDLSSKDKSKELGNKDVHKVVVKHEEIDDATRKARLQKLVEEADMENTEALFAAATSLNKSKSLPPFEQLQPSNKEEFSILRVVLVEKLQSLERRPEYNIFLEDLLRELCTNLKSDDMKNLIKTLTILSNEKLRSEKDNIKGKKKGITATTKKATLKGAAGIDFTDYGTVDYQDGTEFDDFM